LKCAQVRFENREPRPEDLVQIGALKEAIEKKDAAIKRKQGNLKFL
jgi:hypothetical protein